MSYLAYGGWLYVQDDKSCKKMFPCLPDCYWKVQLDMDCFCQFEWIWHLDLVSSSATWKKDSSGSIYFFKENG